MMAEKENQRKRNGVEVGGGDKRRWGSEWSSMLSPHEVLGPEPPHSNLQIEDARAFPTIFPCRDPRVRLVLLHFERF